MDNLTAKLRIFGLSEREGAAYLVLAQLGRMPATVIARKIGAPRTSVYPALESLTKRGLVSQHIERTVTFFSANDPEALFGDIRREQRALQTKAEQAREIVETLRSTFRSGSHSVPHLQYFDGSENVENMLHRFLPEWMTSMQQTGDVLWGYQDHTFVKNYSAWLNSYWKSRSPAHQIRLFSNESAEEEALKNKVKGREVRTLPGGLDLRTTLWISGDYVTVIMTRQEPHYAFQVRDHIFAESLRRIFQSLWSVV